jgi:hypothetical protein
VAVALRSIAMPMSRARLLWQPTAIAATVVTSSGSASAGPSVGSNRDEDALGRLGTVHDPSCLWDLKRDIPRRQLDV